jgi:hypothetical protein
MDGGKMISPDTEFNNVSTHVRYLNEKMIEAFKLFVSLFSAIVGGSIWLSAGEMPAETRNNYYWLSNVLVGLLTIVTVVMIAEYLRSWHQYRHAMSRLGGLDSNGEPKIPPPRTVRASVVEACMMITALILAVLFWYYNPFTLLKK